MGLRRGVGLVLSVIAFATLVSIVGLVVAYLLISREPAVARNSTLMLRISGELTETPPDDWLGIVRGKRTPTIRSLVEDLRKAKVDSRIASVILAPSNLDAPFWGKIQELRDAIVDFRGSGKKIVAYLEYGGDREYYLATACDRVFLLPSSPLDVTGLASYELFLRGTLDKIGAYPDMHHIGDYKTAVNQLTEKTFTPAHREMAESLNQDMYDQLIRGIADGRKKSHDDVRRLLDDGPFLPEEAVQNGLVDDVAYEDEVGQKAGLGGGAGKPIESDDYSRISPGSLGLNRGPRVAILNVVGAIVSGRSGYDPSSGPVSGSETFVGWIRQVRDDSSIKAIVLRIDSPGGSANASDVMWREIVIARRQKPDRPIVASMSDLAASGGYYLAMAAPDIVAEPATLTGSIGIYGGKIVTGGTFNKLGANIAAVSRGKHAEMNSPIRPYNKEEAAKVEGQLQAFYDQFVEKVAEARHMTPEAVDAVAQGRVWTGRQAKDIGLVDTLGGLDRAIAVAKQRAKISPSSEVDLVVYPPRRSVYEVLTQQFMGMDERVAIGALLGAGERRALSALTIPLRLFRRGEPLALMPFTMIR